MSEQKLETFIGEDTAVTVYFDYEPPQKETHDCPPCDAFVMLSSVVIGEDELIEHLSKDCLELLAEKCLESMRD